MEKKIRKIGKSYGITFPPGMVRDMGLKPGDRVSVERKNGEIVISSSEMPVSQGISSDFYDVLEEIIEEHDDALKGLVSR